MEKHLVFFDIDGTLVFNKIGISEKNVAALRRLKEDGHLIFINSGRSRYIVPKLLTQAVEFDGFICGSSYVEYHGEVLNRVVVDRDTIETVCRLGLDNGMRVIFEGEDNAYGINGGAFHACVDITADFESYLDKTEEMRVTKITFDRDLSDDIIDRLPMLRVINFGRYSEAVAKGYDKAFGMNLLCEKLGVPRERTVAFGDSVNDIEMLKFAGKGVIMKSAPAMLDEYSVIRTDSDHEGVAEGIERIFFGE
ncbi:MAG: HAD family phosphatase [Clostridia bacterium]|nr:HAD family phosphatase [Clostridia bacterium]